MSHIVSGLALTHFSAGYPRRQVIRDLAGRVIKASSSSLKD